MATITKRGSTYRIRAYCGYDTHGKQVTRSMTWKPAPGMPPNQIKKEVQRQAVLFEEKCAGQGWGGSMKFETFCKQWFEEYAAPTLRPRTVARLHQMEDRTYAALGHLRLDKVTPRHIQTFINDLGKEGVSQHIGRAQAKDALNALLEERGMDQKQLAEKAAVGRSTVSSVCRGESCTMQTAKKISKALGRDCAALFDAISPKTTLSEKTIRHYHGFVSGVLSYAMRMGMIHTTPPKTSPCPTQSAQKRTVILWMRRRPFWTVWSGHPPNTGPFSYWRSTAAFAVGSCWAWSGQTWTLSTGWCVSGVPASI